MRVGFIRSDIQKLYLNDVEDTSQRNFSSEPKGQSRYFHQATAADITIPLNKWGILSLRGTDVNANVNTSIPNNVLKIQQASAPTFTSITVTDGAIVSKVQIAADLNSAFIRNGLPFHAVVFAAGANRQLQINTMAPNSGPSATLVLDSGAGGSTLNAIVGFNVAGVTMAGLTAAAVLAVVAPPGAIDVRPATINGLSSFSLLTTAQQALIRDGDESNGLADVVAPRLVETGPVLLSFVFGNISKLASAAFQPGGARIGLPAGAAALALDDDGNTPYSI